MEIENTIKVTLSKEDIEQAIKDYASKQFEDEMSKPTFQSIVAGNEVAVVVYKGHPSTTN